MQVITLPLLRKLYPDVDFKNVDGTFEGLVWPEGFAPPSKEDFEAAAAAVAYRDKRRAEYPPIGDQLDALWKGGVDAEAMKAAVAAVKAKYPKPGAK